MLTLIGRGFPATFGFVIAALLMIIIIQVLAVRERRQKTKSTFSGLESEGKEDIVDEERVNMAELKM